MSVAHVIEYSKTSKARCHGPICNGKTMDQGTLRYGRVTKGPYGESVQWRHWGCVTPDILVELGGSNIENTSGYKRLTPADQKKVRLAIASRRIAPQDVTRPSPTGTPGTPVQPGLSILDAVSSNIPAKRRVVVLDDEDIQPVASGSRDNGRHIMASSVLNALDEPERGLDNQLDECVDELYCMVQSSIVGMQYYTGMVGPGEEVSLIRESNNPYDGNAIRVLNIGGVQVGHLPRDAASRLSPLLDRRLITLEGVIAGGAPRRGKKYAVPITLKIFGAPDKRAMLERELLWAAPRGFPPRGSNGVRPIPGAPGMVDRNSTPSASQLQAAAIVGAVGAGPSQNRMTEAQIEALQQANMLRMLLNNLEKVDDGSRRESLLDTLCSTQDVLKLPEHKDPPGIEKGNLEVDLLKHQKQALQWCIEKEYPELPRSEADKPVQFWIYKKLEGKPCYYNIATKTPTATPPELGRGALCADSMGLGKTLTMIALILATNKDVPTDFSRTTLIIVPLSVLSNWESQIKQHCTSGSLSYYTYYGSGRNASTHELKKYDVVITTYQVVTKEFTDGVEPILQEEALAKLGLSNGGGASKQKKQKKSLPTMFAMRWKRIILDEGHTIRNPRTKTAQAVYELAAHRRWVVTGTPIINSPKDLGSILQFLKICKPLDNEDYFNRLLIRPLKDGSPEGCGLLRALMSQICIRRTKEMQDSTGKPLVALPPVDMTLIRVPIEGRARELYDAVEALSREAFRQHMEETGGETVPTNVLGMLTRLRQLALHPGLVPPTYVDELRDRGTSGAPKPAINLNPEDKAKLQAALAKMIEDSEECPVCFGILNDPRITTCSHAFCLACISEVIQRDPKCPMDRRAITMGDLIEPLPPSELTQALPLVEDEEDDDDEFRNGSSAKIDHLIYLLRSLPTNEKSLVFSQFTSFLDKIAHNLELHGISYVRFDGQMSNRQRQEVLAKFCQPLDDDEAPIPPRHPSSEREEPSRRSSRASSKSANASFDSSTDADNVGDDDDDKDKDYVDTAKDDDDDDFLGGDLDLSLWLKKSKGKGKGKAKPKMKSRVSSAGKNLYNGSAFEGENPRVLLISLKAGALGLNLTVANNVFLMDPWWQEGIESQAIDRCNRIGQTKKVNVYQLIAENTVESKVIEIQEKKKKLIKEAFSGMKGAETQRQRREARAQDLVEIFGMRDEYRRGRGF